MRRVVLLLCLIAATGCARTTASDRASPPPPSGGPVRWMCRPDRPNDACLTADLTTTEIHADGTRSVLDRRADPSARIDCFYVYPTVDLELVPGNHDDLVDTARVLAVTLAQAGAFRETCALWVPLYRQVTLGTYLQSRDVLEAGLTKGFADVERAFREYLAVSDPGRKVVLVGHSQGGEMVVRLLRRFFDRDASMRRRLLVAMAIGAEVEVPIGKTTGATFESLPICSRPLETGCVVAYRTHASGERIEAGRFVPAAGNHTVCVDPAAIDRPASRLSRAVFPTRDVWGGPLAVPADVKTPYVALDGFYTAGCTRGERGYAYLQASADPPPGDVRTSPVDFSHRRFRIGKLGLHVLDLQLANGDLVDVVRRRAGR